MIHRDTAFRLPLMHHLVQQGVLHVGPGVAGDVAAADGDFHRLPAADLHAQLAEPRPHPAGEAERQAPESPAKMLAVEPLVGLAQPVKQQQVARTRPLAPGRRWRRRGMLLHWKLEELALRGAAHRSRQAGVEKPDDGPKDPVRRMGVPSMQAQRTSCAEADHDDPIGVGGDSDDAAEAEQVQAGGQGIGIHNP